MAIDHPIFDPEANRKVLLDHIFLISAGEITRAARTWLVEQLTKANAATSFSWTVMNFSINPHVSCWIFGLIARWPSRTRTFRFRWLADLRHSGYFPVADSLMLRSCSSENRRHLPFRASTLRLIVT